LHLGSQNPKMASGGRHQSVVHQLIVDQGPTTGEKRRWKCPYCTATRETKILGASQWADHLVLHCSEAPDEVKQRVARAHRTAAIKRAEPPELALGAAPEAKKPKASGVFRAFVDHCDEKRAEVITAAIATFIVGCALPFSIVQSVFFVAMLKSLNAAYITYLPKTDAFRNRWVPELFRDTKNKIDHMWHAMGDPLRTLAFDGFKTEAGTHVVNVTEYAAGKVAFKSVVDPGLERENAQFYYELCEEELWCGTPDGKNVEDNVGYTVAAMSMLEEKFPTLITGGCAAHC